MKKRLWIGCMATLAVLLAVYGQGAGLQFASSGAPAAAQVDRLIDQYCISCHTQTNPNGVALDQLDLARVGAEAERWERVVRQIRAGQMPPSGSPRPDHATLEAKVEWLENQLDRNPAVLLPPPGPRRINRTEYANVIRDLLALEVDATAPEDGTRGFDNTVAGQGLSPAVLEAYLSAADKISRLAVAAEVPPPTQVIYRLPGDNTQNYHVKGLPFGTRGGILIRHEFPADGEYEIKVTPINRGLMGGSQAFGDVRGEKLEVVLDGERVGLLLDWDEKMRAGGGRSDLRPVEIRVAVRAGLHTLGVAFRAAHYAPLLHLNHPFERSTIELGGLPGFIQFYPHIASVGIEGPYYALAPDNTPSRKKIFVCYPATAKDEEACARRIISTLAGRAFRQPPKAEDLTDLMSLYESGRMSGVNASPTGRSQQEGEGSFDQAIGLALQGILAHPKFIYRIESEPAGLAEGRRYPISDWELASRLSFFLWSTIPDQELTTLASQGRLRQPAVLEQQVRRMLADPRSQALALDFAVQWLKLDQLEAVYPAVELFPDFDDNLRQALRREVECFFDSVVREDRSIVDLLTADYTFLNERLAKHYGIPGIYGSLFRRVTLPPEFDARRGLLGKGGVHVVSALPTRTSLVRRGSWVLETILGARPPDPLPLAHPRLSDEADVRNFTLRQLEDRIRTLREQMEISRRVETCASCHKIMDPIGRALENFDAIGTWRTQDAGSPIDSSGQLADGTPINGVADLRQTLALSYSLQFARNVTERLLAYAVGRGVGYYDMPTVRAIVRDAARNSYRFSSLVLGIVKSDAFRMNMKLTQSQARAIAGLQ